MSLQISIVLLLASIVYKKIGINKPQISVIKKETVIQKGSGGLKYF